MDGVWGDGMSQKSPRNIRIFISSPGDVGEERERARQVIEGLRRRYARHASLDPIFWEDLPLQAEASFQQGIDLVLSDQSGIDIAVFILWARLGSPLGNVIRKPDDSEYLSGTEREFHLMLEARRQSPASSGPRLRPDILFYRRIDDSSFDERLRGRATSEQQDLLKQKTLVESFFDREFSDAKTGANTRAFHVFDRPTTFSQRLRGHLVELLDPLLQRDDTAVIWDLEAKGAPYLGLSSFRAEHADIFFGREEEILEARHALKEQARNGCAFLMLSGASASGKSSLAQAGVAPAVIDNEIDDQVKAWRQLVVSPSELAPHLQRGLLFRICSEGVLPQLRADLLQPEFVDAFLSDPERAVSLALRPAFERLAVASGGGVRLILVVDQLEELFVGVNIGAEERGGFLRALEALTRSGFIWIVATVRADFYHHVQSEPALVRMKAGAGQLDVAPPGPDALRRMVEEPAIRAGLVFERLADGTSVSDLILRDAVAHPELLPLIEDLLRELYEHRNGNTLTLAAYEALGRSVENAMQLRAERVFADLSVQERSVFERVLEMLVTHGQSDIVETGGGADAPLVRQWADLSRFDANAPERRLIKAFVDARLFTAGSHPETGVPSATVAHESLLRAWPRAVEWAQENRAFLHTRALVARRLKDGSPLLDGDPLLNAARDHLARNPAGFTPELVSFVTESVRAAEEGQRRIARRRRQLASIAVGAAIAVIAAGLGSLLYFSDQRTRDASAGQLVAEAQSGIAQRDFAHAEIAAASALTFRNTREARELLLSARSNGVRFVRSSHEGAAQARWTAFSQDGAVAATVLASAPGQGVQVSIFDEADGREMWRLTLPDNAGAPDSIQLSDQIGATRYLAVAWPETGGGEAFHVQVWSLVKGAPAGEGRALDDLRGIHTKRVPSMAFSTTWPYLITSGEDRRLSLWDVSTEKPSLIWTRSEAHGTAVHGVAFSADGNFVASGGGDYKAKIWRVSDMLAAGPEVPSEEMPLEETLSEPEAPEMPPTDDSNTPIEASETVPEIVVPRRVDPVFELEGHSDSVFAVAFSPDGKRLATAGYDRVIRIWDMELRDAKSQPVSIATLAGHEGTVLSLTFSADGAFLYSGSKDESVRVWSVKQGRLQVMLRPEIGVVRSLSAQQFEDDIRIGGEGGWSLWSIHGGDLATLLWNGGATIGSIAFDPSGDLLAAGGDDGRVRIWDRSFSAPRLLDDDKREASDESINGIVFSPDGRWLAAAGEGQAVHVWDRTQNWSSVIPAEDESLRHDGPIWGICFDAKSRWLATANTDANIRIRQWNTQGWGLLRQTEALSDTPYALACASNGRLVSGDSRGYIKVRDAGTLAVTNETVTVSQAEVNVWSLSLDDNPAAIFSGNSDGRVHRWVPGDGPWGPHEESGATSDEDARINPTVNSVSVSRSRGWIAAGGDGASVEIYDRALRHVRSLRGHDGTVWWVTFDPQGVRLAYGGIDGVLRIYNLEDIDHLLESADPATLYDESVASTGLELRNENGQLSITLRN